MGKKLADIEQALKELERDGRIRRENLAYVHGHLHQVITLIR